jgi:hypothetical protein
MNWTVKIDQISRKFEQHFEQLNGAELNWKPDANTWSIAQNIEHLIVVNETYYPVLAALKQKTYKTPFIARFGFFVAFLGKTVLNAVAPDRNKKMKTFKIWEPEQSQMNSDILKKFAQHQHELKQQIAGAKKLAESGCVIASPANKNVVYTLKTAFDIIVTHEQRHLEQAKEVLILLKKR